MTVERFLPSQIGRIVAIETAAFPREPFSKELFLELSDLCGDGFFVVRMSSRIVGYVIACRRGEHAEIVSIAVAPTFRRRGAGRALLDHVLRWLRRRKTKSVRLVVRASNTHAIQLYRSFGFRRTRRLASYYDDEDGIAMNFSPL